MAGLCEKHGCYYKGDKCPGCNAEDIKEWKADFKEKKKAAKPKKYDRFKKYRDQNKTRLNLKARLQKYWRLKIFNYYKERGLTKRCWICDKPFIEGSKHIMSVPHVGHYYAKGSLYQLWNDPVNSGILCYDHNVNKPETVLEMEPAIIKVWGHERLDDLKKRAEEYSFRIKTRQDRKNPTDEWFLAMIEITKKMTIQ